MADQQRVTLSLSHEAIFRLATLCDARAHRLRFMITEGILPEDEVPDVEVDIAELDNLAVTLRRARDD